MLELEGKRKSLEEAAKGAVALLPVPACHHGGFARNTVGNGVWITEEYDLGRHTAPLWNGQRRHRCGKPFA